MINGILQIRRKDGKKEKKEGYSRQRSRPIDQSLLYLELKPKSFSKWPCEIHMEENEENSLK